MTKESQIRIDELSLQQLAGQVLYEVDVTLRNLSGNEGKPDTSYLLSALRWIERQTHTRTNHAQMLVGLREGLFLREFTRRTFSSRILEIGSFTGYSLCCLAEGARGCTVGGVASQPILDRHFKAVRSTVTYVDAIEINRELDYIIEEGLQRAGVSELVKVFFGDAVKLLSLKKDGLENGIAEEYDLVFIDADKRQYPQYYELTLPLVKPGGYILADNVSWYGRTEDHSDPKSAGISSFNSIVESDSRVESHLVDIRDGLLVIRRK
ncbi:MAG: class I SAM-dependent methyltransferase [Bacteroidales bacterium]|nr:class I SAM-dependent methyltransferase [Bacteroidales bacterium]